MERNYKFDNLKILLMLLVVIAHTLINSYGHPGMEFIRFLCLSFTMPMFFFISGYFSHTEIDAWKLTRRLAIPCVVFSTFYHLYKSVIDPTYTIPWLNTGFAMWYLMVLYIYRLVLPVLVKYKHILLLSFVLSWIVGLFPFIGAKLNLSRIFCFLPFFLLGFYYRNEQEKAQGKFAALYNLTIVNRGGVVS